MKVFDKFDFLIEIIKLYNNLQSDTKEKEERDERNKV